MLFEVLLVVGVCWCHELFDQSVCCSLLFRWFGDVMMWVVVSGSAVVRGCLFDMSGALLVSLFFGKLWYVACVVW